MRKNALKRIKCRIEKEFVLFIFTVLLVILTVLMPYRVDDYYRLVDWHTIGILAGLLVITTGLRKSGYFDYIALKLIAKFRTERALALFLVMFSAFISAFLTNDITLFIVVPITLSIQNVLENDITRLVIFEAIAVNVGSALTPIGNPQNLYLWRAWGISFPIFVVRMFPLTLIQSALLVLFTIFSFTERELRKFEGASWRSSYDLRLLVLSVLTFIFYIVAIELGHETVMLLVIFAVYTLFFARKVILHVDWLLLLLFVVIFIDFGVLSTTPSIRETTMSLLKLNRPQNVFISSALLSQIISNVPASVFISKLNNDWLAITYGVNVGGNGLIIGSLANIIALRICEADKKAWLIFHRYSIPFFALSMLLLLLYL